MDTLNSALVAYHDNSVQIGTALITPEITRYVDTYRSFVRKTAESVIGLAVTIVEAAENLSDEDFQTFCNEIDIKKGSAFYKKLMSIGRAAPRLQVASDVLPTSWTTIYLLATIPPQQFDRLHTDKVLSPVVTASEIRGYLGMETKKRQSVDAIHCEANVVSISLKTLDPSSLKAVTTILTTIANSYGCEIRGLGNVQANNELSVAA